ncbi:MAG: thymidylate synthase [Candidatus Izemoplasma sp.]
MSKCKHIETKTFEEAFIKVNKLIRTNPDFNLESRIGQCQECHTVSFTVEDPTTFEFQNTNINRIPYHYAETFYDFMMSGKENALEAFKNYSAVIPFIDKPKSKDIPDNFNSLYGPRIKRQLKSIIKELSDNPESRRATILILNESDHVLLDKDETLEFPCTISMTYFIRDGKLNAQVDMRSQNTAIVLQLDMYLQGKALCYLASVLGVGLGSFSSTMVSGHIFDRDFEYIDAIINE